jgi:hypothetical protein
MKKIAYIFLLLSLVMQVAFAQQRSRPVIVEFLDGSVLKGEITRLQNDNRLRLLLPNRTVKLFLPKDVKKITYEDGTFLPLKNIPFYQPQGQNRQGSNPQNRQGQTQNPQNRQGAAPQNRQQGQNQQSPQNRQGNNQQQGQNRQGTAPQNRQQNPQNRQGTTPQPNKPQPKTNNQPANDDLLSSEEGTDITLTPADKKQVPAEAVQEQTFKPHGVFMMDAGYTVGMGDTINKASRIEFSLGYGMQLTPNISVGLGAGLHLYSDTIYGAYRNSSAASHYDSVYMKMSIPIFVDAKYSFVDGNIAPYIGLRLGYSIGMVTTVTKFDKVNGNTTERWKREELAPAALGFYISPSVGVKIAAGPSAKVTLALGYTMQMRSYEISASPQSGTLSGITVKAGLEF